MDELINGFFVLQVSIRAVPTEFYRKQKKKNTILSRISTILHLTEREQMVATKGYW